MEKRTTTGHPLAYLRGFIRSPRATRTRVKQTCICVLFGLSAQRALHASVPTPERTVRFTSRALELYVLHQFTQALYVSHRETVSICSLAFYLAHCVEITKFKNAPQLRQSTLDTKNGLKCNHQSTLMDELRPLVRARRPDRARVLAVLDIECYASAHKSISYSTPKNVGSDGGALRADIGGSQYHV